MHRDATVRVVVVAWLSIIAVGVWLWERYDTTPGSRGASTSPNAEPTDERWRLTVFAHPRCPCTRATVRELAEIVRAAPRLSVRVLFVRPTGTRDDWEHGDAWCMATQIHGAEVACDADGAEARRSGSETSGFAVLSDPTGRDVFRGGLTQARGRTGESSGRRAVLAWIESGTGAPTAPVYGCPLLTSDD
jgi:hypothetical protein